ncbi:hypothetical protein bas27_0081 [Escherichia phage TrudiGerster]|uniref:Uncharacterized protein n=1 Tax=Escherichia phage TrudiGerster TaxID=2851991 RepID=A0AAE8B3X4_9CAUD|nr:hypothetical protein bas27_0081 [Escherichia phage TrudiGerster]
MVTYLIVIYTCLDLQPRRVSVRSYMGFSSQLLVFYPWVTHHVSHCDWLVLRSIV